MPGRADARIQPVPFLGWTSPRAPAGGRPRPAGRDPARPRRGDRGLRRARRRPRRRSRSCPSGYRADGRRSARVVGARPGRRRARRLGRRGAAGRGRRRRLAGRADRFRRRQPRPRRRAGAGPSVVEKQTSSLLLGTGPVLGALGGLIAILGAALPWQQTVANRLEVDAFGLPVRFLAGWERPHRRRLRARLADRDPGGRRRRGLDDRGRRDRAPRSSGSPSSWSAASTSCSSRTG